MLTFAPIFESGLYLPIKNAANSKSPGITKRRMKSHKKTFPAVDIPSDSSTSVTSSGSTSAVIASSSVLELPNNSSSPNLSRLKGS